jgi:signal transduction histidine kinase
MGSVSRRVYISIRWKVIIPLLAVVVVGFAASSYFSVFRLGRELESNAVTTARVLTRAWETDIAAALEARRPQEIAPTLDLKARLPGIERLAVLDSRGHLINSHGRLKDRPLPRDLARRLGPARSSDRVIGWRENSRIYHALAAVRTKDGRVWGYIMVDLSIAHTEQRIAAARRATLAANVITIVVVVTAAALAANVLVHKPLQKLRETMARVASGDLAARAPSTSADELGQLEESFNRMIEQIEAKNKALIEAQEQLVLREKLASIGLLAAGVAHEINNPLATISVAAERLAEVAGATPEQKQMAERILSQCARVTQTISDLLSFDRTGRFDMVHFDPVRLVEDAIEAADAGSARIEVSAPSMIPKVRVDPVKMRQALANILLNAVQASRPDGKVTVELARIGNWLQISVSDSGPGIRPENLRRIFDPFFTTKEEGEGRGLGLAIAYEIVKNHGGEVAAISPAPGTHGPQKGTMMKVRLPLEGQGAVSGG